MDFSFTPYLLPYIILFFFWMISIHRQVLFWLYLWQLKEYHLGRFLDHFSTAKGKSLFVNPLFAAKTVVLFFGIIYLGKNLIFIAIILLLFFAEAIRAGFGIVRMKLLRPVVTKKSLLLLVATHILFFLVGIIIFNLFLGEMDLREFGMAALALLTIDIALPLIVSVVVLLLQPLTVYEKNKILACAQTLIENRPDLVVIGISGSYGKSSVKELLAKIFESKFKVLKTQANINTEIGVAQTVINDLKPEHQIFVCEIGAVHKGRIRQVADAIKPKIGILTGINQQHLAVFGGQQNIIDAKFEILESLPESGTAILNWNSSLIRESFESQKQRIKAKNILFSGKDVFASEIKTTIDRLSFILNYRDEKIAINTNARGAFMVEPILLAASGAMAAGMNFAQIAQIINHLDFTPFNIKATLCGGPTPASCADKKFDCQYNILESTYSSNPDGVAAHLDYLKLWPGKKAIIMPCLIELGSASKDVHFKIGQKIAQVCDFAVITSKDRFGEIKKGAISAGMKKENIIFSEKSKTINELIKNRLFAGDVILLEGRLTRLFVEIYNKKG